MSSQLQTRRSQIYRWHEQRQANFVTLHGGRVVESYGDVLSEVAAVKTAAICDLSLLGRTGFKGRGAPAWLSRSLKLPETANQAVLQKDGSLVASLSTEEHLIIDALSGDAATSNTLNEAFGSDAPQSCYSLPRADSHALFALAGEFSPDVLATLCAVDLRPEHFAVGAVAQTSLARMSAVIIRVQAASEPVFFILSDVSGADYLWGCLDEATVEFGGRAVGYAAVTQRLQTL